MSRDGLTLKDIYARYSAMHPAKFSLGVDFGGVVVRVRTDNQLLHQELCGYFREFLSASESGDIEILALETSGSELPLKFEAKPPESGKTKVKEEFSELPDARAVRKSASGMTFLFGGGLNLALGPCLANANQIVNFVNNRFIERMLNQGCLLAHASAVTLAGRGLAVAGFAGMGKSTLALRLLSLGANFLSNDRMVVGSSPAGPEMFGVAKQPRINPGTVLGNPDLSAVMAEEAKDELRQLGPDELWELEHKYDALVHECFGPGRFSLRAPFSGLIILNWRREAGETLIRKIDPRERADLLSAFEKREGLFYLPDAAGLTVKRDSAAYAEFLSQVDVFEISGGVDFTAAGHFGLNYLKTGLGSGDAPLDTLWASPENLTKRRNQMDKNKLSAKLHLELPEAAKYLEGLAQGFKSGTICVSQGEENLVLTPAKFVEIEIEAKVKKGTSKFSLEIEWDSEPCGDLSITGSAPEVSVAEPAEVAPAEPEVEPVEAEVKPCAAEAKPCPAKKDKSKEKAAGDPNPSGQQA